METIFETIGNFISAGWTCFTTNIFGTYGGIYIIFNTWIYIMIGVAILKATGIAVDLLDQVYHNSISYQARKQVRIETKKQKIIDKRKDIATKKIAKTINKEAKKQS